LARVNTKQKQIKPINMTNTTTQKKEFRVQIDQLCTIWTSSIKFIEATTQEEADKLALEMYNNGELFENLEDFVYNYDTVKETESMDIINGEGNTLIRIN
jgi:hypothetical protein